jgi:hypothetical protein
MAVLTITVTSVVMVMGATLTGYFYFIKLSDIKQEHERDMRHAALMQWRRELDLQPFT